MDWSVITRPEKEIVRQHAFSGYQQRHGAIILPGWDEDAGIAGKCIRGALQVTEYAPEHISIDLDRPLYCVERDRSLFPKVRRSISALGFSDARFHSGNLSTLPITGEVDFAFIDLCGTLDPAMLRWMRDALEPNLVTNAIVGFTMLKSARGSDFILAAFYAMVRHYRDLYIEMRETFRVVKPQILVPLFLLRCAMKNHDFGTEIVEYKDTTPMMFIRLTNASKTKTDWPDLEEVLSLAAQMADAKRKKGTRRPFDPVPVFPIATKTIHERIIDILRKREIATSEQIRGEMSASTNEVAFALVELQNANRKRRGGNGRGDVVKISSSPNTYALREHLVRILA